MDELYPLLDIEPGTQIVYIPTHIQDKYAPKGEIGRVGGMPTEVLTEVTSYNGVQCGFVFREHSKGWQTGVFCRYFYPDGTLRTRANSELTPLDCLFVHVSRSQGEVDQLLKRIQEELNDN